ncbi:ThiF family adenylyltransferase [Microbispora hainanensis]|uniref:ThiF family adenylyltransferase n=1 Tax=Microbispora hainanensis TaxID=568844 RepID=A0ABZ1SKR0_9ACTN|nr:ThiF family adenylyltransferase [Microbispora hainanensis]
MARLREEGYEVDVRDGYLLVGHVPYVSSDGSVQYGTLVSELTLSGEVTMKPSTHVAMFVGGIPCDAERRPLRRILLSESPQQLAPGLKISCSFSSKPQAGYRDYYEKMTTYVAILSGYAQRLEPAATARTFPVIEESDPDSVFLYTDTASSRAGLGAINAKLEQDRVAIVGLGGTGSHILDLLAKTCVREIHLFDGDVFRQHNAFRAPGATPCEELLGGPNKAVHFAEVYSRMRRGIIAHGVRVDETNVEKLREMDFVFLAIDDGPSRRRIVESLREFEIAFLDVGLGVYEVDGVLAGLIRVTTGLPGGDHDAEDRRLPYAAGPDNDYNRNIQVVELNALNAALAVLKWKKLRAFYADQEHEQHSVYQIGGNLITNEDAS